MLKAIQKTTVRILFILLILQCGKIFGQTDAKLSLDKGTIDNQFNYILTNASKYEEYKVVKEGWLWVLKAHVADTLKLLHKELRTFNNLVNARDATIDSLKTELANTTELYTTTYNEKNSLRFLGILLSKSAYNSLLWTIILGLLFIVVILFLLFKKSNSTTTQTKQDLQELKNEFEIHRKRTLEREEKISRQHLDEINKYKK